MVHIVSGGVTCNKCGTVHEKTEIMDIVTNDDSYGTLIWCEICQEWVKWL